MRVDSTNDGKFSGRFDQALIVAALAHQSQKRKGTAVPYLMHPFHVALLLERHGFSEDVVIAAMEAGLTDRAWDMAEIVAMIDAA